MREGFNQSEVARGVEVCSQTVSRWAKAVSEDGEKAVRAAGRAGRKPLLDEKQRDRLVVRLLEGRRSSATRRHCGPASGWAT